MPAGTDGPLRDPQTDAPLAPARRVPPTPAEVARDALPHTAVPGAWKAGETTSAPLPEAWLARFGDPALWALVAEALAHIGSAAARTA